MATTSDPAIEAIAALVRAAVQSDVGRDTLVKVYEDPRVLMSIADSDRPVLCVYRESWKTRTRESGIVVEDTVIAFDYAMANVTLDEKAAAWPVLVAVARSISRAVIARSHVAVSDGADVLTAAGIDDVDADSFTAKPSMAQSGREQNDQLNELCPVVQARITVTWSEADVDPATLDNFLELYTAFDEPGGDFTDPLMGADSSGSTPDDSTDIVTLPAADP